MQIESLVADAAKKKPEATELYRTVWRPKLDAFRNELELFSRRCDLRPTLCIMGKRGQGKTTLLQNWLGRSETRFGLDEIWMLPTGQIDTTACLVRLTNATGRRKPFNSAFLYVDLLNSRELGRRERGKTSRPRVAEVLIKIPATSQGHGAGHAAGNFLPDLPLSNTG